VVQTVTAVHNSEDTLMQTIRSLRKSREGQAVVEFALILPVFLLIVFAAIEFGRAYYVSHLLASAAREGAREGSLPNRTEADVEDKVEDFVRGVELDYGQTTTTIGVIPAGSSDVDSSMALADATSGDRVRVTVEYDFDVLTGSIIPGFSGTVTLAGRCAFRHE
jgi:Flp pilus assembly protein TadG